VDVALRLGLTRQRVVQLDHLLRPQRCACGARRYDPAAVAAYEAQREIDRAALSAARADHMRAIRDEYQPRRYRKLGNPPPTWRR
jgi:hypothetical protein